MDSALGRLEVKLSKLPVKPYTRRVGGRMVIVKGHERVNPFAAKTLTVLPEPKNWDDPIVISLDASDIRLGVEHSKIDTGSKYPRNIIKAVDENGRETGRLEWQRFMGQRFPVIQWVGTFSGAEKRGIATALLLRARLIEPNLRHSSDTTLYGESWIRSLRKAGVKTPRVRHG